MPVDFFDVFLALVDKKELRRYFPTTRWRLIHWCPRLIVILLDAEIPEGDLIVCPGSGKYRIFGGMPLDGSDWRVVPRKSSDWDRIWRRGSIYKNTVNAASVK